MFNVNVHDIHHVYHILLCFTTFVTGNHGTEGIVMPKDVFENNSDDDKQLKEHNII